MFSSLEVEALRLFGALPEEGPAAMAMPLLLGYLPAGSGCIQALAAWHRLQGC